MMSSDFTVTRKKGSVRECPWILEKPDLPYHTLASAVFVSQAKYLDLQLNPRSSCLDM